MTEKAQLPLFGPTLNPTSRLKASMRQAIRESRHSREQICDRMNQRAASEGICGWRGNKVTLAALDGWVAETKDNLIPVQLLPAFCWAAESILPLKVLADGLGAQVVDAREAKLLALAKIEREAERLARARRRLLRDLKEEGHA